MRVCVCVVSLESDTPHQIRRRLQNSLHPSHYSIITDASPQPLSPNLRQYMYMYMYMYTYMYVYVYVYVYMYSYMYMQYMQKMYMMCMYEMDVFMANVYMVYSYTIRICVCI